MMKSVLTDLELLGAQVETLFRLTDANRLLSVNEPERPHAPQFFLGRTLQGNLYRFGHELPLEIVERLESLASSEPVVDDLRASPRHLDAYLEILQSHKAVREVWSGPAYRLSEAPVWPTGVVRITDANSHLLADEWLEEQLAEKQLCVAVVEEGQALSVCHSSRTSLRAAEAGLETLPAYRGRGYALAAVQGWAAAVYAQGRIPLYSTSWANAASQRVARKLGLTMYASDFHIT